MCGVYIICCIVYMLCVCAVRAVCALCVCGICFMSWRMCTICVCCVICMLSVYILSMLYVVCHGIYVCVHVCVGQRPSVCGDIFLSLSPLCILRSSHSLNLQVTVDETGWPVEPRALLPLPLHLGLHTHVALGFVCSCWDSTYLWILTDTSGIC